MKFTEKHCVVTLAYTERLTCNFNRFKHHLARAVKPQLFTRKVNVFI